MTRRSAVHGPDPRGAVERAGLLVIDVAAADDATALASSGCSPTGRRWAQ
ncbi:DUF6207 family protein [Streptomyces sviceus]